LHDDERGQQMTINVVTIGNSHAAAGSHDGIFAAPNN
jgi:hypothetical protein